MTSTHSTHPTHTPLRVRPAAVAGAFYPSDPRELATMIDALLADASAGSAPRAARRPRALVVPHAGYVYSGPVAASAYATIRDVVPAYRRVVVVGPAHRVALQGIAVSSADMFATPLGDVAIDTDARDALLGLPGVVVDDAAHELEHSVEVQLPFLQRVVGDVPVLPLVVGDAPTYLVADVLHRVWDDDTLLVVSTDLSHYLDHATAQVLDARTAARIVAGDADAISDRDACGAYGLRPLLVVGRRRHLHVDLLDLRSSGDTAGSRDRVVGYGAFVLEPAP